MNFESNFFCDSCGQPYCQDLECYCVLKYKTKPNKMEDNVNHPKHYVSNPFNLETIEITRHYDFCIGNALKYIFRSGLKKEVGMSEVEKQIEDLKKAVWYINDKIKQLEDANKQN